MKSLCLSVFGAALCSLFTAVNPVFAQGTAFTYQGRLNDNGSPVSGSYDLQCTLYATNITGGAVAGPLTNSATAVTNGLFTVTLDFGSGVFNGAAYWLEVGVRTNTGGTFTTLIPRQQLTPSPYAIFAEGANASGLSGTIPAGNIANGSISGSQLASGAVVSNLNASGQAGVASGGTILSASNNNTSLLNAGYVKIGVIQSGDLWQQRINGTPPAGRAYHTAVWTGSEMIVWGGTTNLSNPVNDGGRYNPSANNWAAVSTNNAPSPRYFHTAVWTGSEMIVWGGFNGSTYLNDGGRYNPTANSWTSLAGATGTPPAARGGHTAVWTGSEMIVWGGGNGSYLNDGGRYNPTANSWTSLASATGTPPAARGGHTAVWTGSEMIVWGGWNGSLFSGYYFNDGGRYNPTTNGWAAVTTTGAPAGRYYHTAVWTGSEMIVWGGGNSSYLNDGGRFNPTGNGGSGIWTSLAGATGTPPAARQLHTVVWTGSEMIVWGGGNGSYLNDGGRYNPTGDSWTAVTTTGGPAARDFHTAVWTGNEMIVWGGSNGNLFNDTRSYTPGQAMFLYQKP